MNRSILTVATMAVAALALSSCAASPSTSEKGAADGKLNKVVIATQPIVDSAPLYLGKELGFFADEGIELEIQAAAGGAAVVPGVISGSFDLGRGNLLSTMLAVDQGLDLRCIANANSTSGTPDFGAVVVLPDSPIATIADLPGHTVTVNTLANIGDTTIRSVVQEAGGDPSTIDFVEVPFADAPAALENGQVDAAWIMDPFLTEALDRGARVLSYNFAEFHPDLDISCIFATGDVIDHDPELVSSFQKAMNKSLEYSQNNPDEVRAIVGTYTEMDVAVLAKMVLPTFRTDFSREAAEKLGQKATEYGTLSQEPDLDTLLP